MLVISEAIISESATSLQVRKNGDLDAGLQGYDFIERIFNKNCQLIKIKIYVDSWLEEVFGNRKYLINVNHLNKNAPELTIYQYAFR